MLTARLTPSAGPANIGGPEHALAASSHDVTELLHAWSAGDASARERLVSLVYRELRRRAITHMRRERPDHALQPTELVHETYLRLVEQNRIVWQNRSQFFQIASEIMRRILVDQARAHLTGKRSGQWSRVSLDEGVAVSDTTDVEVLDLDAALNRLATFDTRKSQVAELRFFVGLSLEEIADVLSVSRATIERDWQKARAWLFKELSGHGTGDDA